MKPLVLAVLVSLFAGCASKDQAAPSAPAVSPHQAEEEQNCRRSLTGPGKRPEGETCGGSTNLSCAEGLTCVSKFKCVGAVGTCQKQ